MCGFLKQHIQDCVINIVILCEDLEKALKRLNSNQVDKIMGQINLINYLTNLFFYQRHEIVINTSITFLKGLHHRIPCSPGGETSASTP